MSVFQNKKTKRWVAQVYDPSVKRKFQVGTYRTKAEANKAMAAAVRRQDRSDTTVREFWERWLVGHNWKESTRQHRRERTVAFVDLHGDKRLADVTRSDARRWLAERPSTIPALSAMFGAAMYEDDEHGDQLITANPFSRLVHVKKARRDLRADWLTGADVDALEDTAVEVHGPVFGLTIAGMIRFAAETGIRPGELYVVQDDDLRPAEGKLLVRRAASSQTRLVDTPKNGQAREVVMSTRAYQAALRAQRWDGVDRIFSTTTGRQFWAPSLNYYWQPVRCAAGRPKMAFAELRHFCATRLLEAGLDYPDVARQLGHTDGGELVRQVYGHPSENRALDRVRDVLDGPGEAAA